MESSFQGNRLGIEDANLVSLSIAEKESLLNEIKEVVFSSESLEVPKKLQIIKSPTLKDVLSKIREIDGEYYSTNIETLSLMQQARRQFEEKIVDSDEEGKISVDVEDCNNGLGKIEVNHAEKDQINKIIKDIRGYNKKWYGLYLDILGIPNNNKIKLGRAYHALRDLEGEVLGALGITTNTEGIDLNQSWGKIVLNWVENENKKALSGERIVYPPVNTISEYWQDKASELERQEAGRMSKTIEGIIDATEVKLPEAEKEKITKAFMGNISDEWGTKIERNKDNIIAALQDRLKPAATGAAANIYRWTRGKHGVEKGDHTIHKNDLKEIVEAIKNDTITSFPKKKSAEEGRGR